MHACEFMNVTASGYVNVYVYVGVYACSCFAVNLCVRAYMSMPSSSLAGSMYAVVRFCL